jgi:U3 small nucleolar RNA-associated protein MPP10
MPPQITQETTNLIEALVRQRILDELFDDPIRRMAGEVNKGMDNSALDFTKSGKGLGDQYADDYANKLMKENGELFLDNDISGVDSALKKEIDDIFNGVMKNLNSLSNIHFTPKKLTKESKIRTQNVASL